MKKILCYGNPQDGFTYVGPFDTGSDAVEYGERFDDDYGDWWVIDLEAPDRAYLDEEEEES